MFDRITHAHFLTGVKPVDSYVMPTNVSMDGVRRDYQPENNA